MARTSNTGTSLARGIIVAAGMAAALGAAPAHADDDTASTWVKFEVVAPGGLYISAPCAVALSGASPGDTAAGRLGEVRVTDERAAQDAAWIATVTLDRDFATGSRRASETIPGGDVVYHPGAAIDSFNGPFTPGRPGTLADTRMAFSHPSGSGNNYVAWNPTLKVHVPATEVAGAYRGVVTHSVA